MGEGGVLRGGGRVKEGCGMTGGRRGGMRDGRR